MNLRGQPNTTSFLSHVNQHSASLADLAERSVQLIAAIAAPRTENVACETFTVDADESRFGLRNFAFHEREMMGVVHR